VTQRPGLCDIHELISDKSALGLPWRCVKTEFIRACRADHPVSNAPSSFPMLPGIIKRRSAAVVYRVALPFVFDVIDPAA
jgi:hypothetical protein